MVVVNKLTYLFVRFTISLEELIDGEDLASCPSCTLRIRIIFDEESLPSLDVP